MNDDKKESYREYAQVKSREFQVWEADYRKRIFRILQDRGIPLTLETIPEIVEATSFRALSSNPRNKSHCTYFRCDPLKRCHPEIKDLNCFLCSCPDYDSGFIQISENGHGRISLGKCRANSKKGKYFFPEQFSGVGMWDCSDCTAYHHPQAVEKYLRIHMKELQEQAKELLSK
jgi:Zn-finger protein